MIRCDKTATCGSPATVTFLYRDRKVNQCLTHACHTIISDDAWRQVVAIPEDVPVLTRRD